MNVWKAIILLLPCLSLAQVNTEKLRADEKAGFSGNLSLGYGMAMGNSEYLSFTPAARIDYNTKKYTSFIAASYNRKQSELKSGRKFLLAHKGFAHVRTARKCTPYLSWELFGQWEFNEFINLERRLLGGTGARINPLYALSLPTVHLVAGVGGMFEHETYHSENVKPLWRSTNYLSFRWNFTKQGSVHLTGYYQVAVKELHDFRIIADGGIRFNLATWLVFGASVGGRFDNDPIDAVAKKYDFDLNNNLAVEF